MNRELRLGAVILTQGNRPEDLRRLLDSLASQEGPRVETVVVGNGVTRRSKLSLPEWVHFVGQNENLGIPGGRNVGVREIVDKVDVIMVLDDDGELAGDMTARRVREAFTAEPRLGIVSFRILDPRTGLTQRRHVPRVRVGDPRHSSNVTTFLGGACAIRSSVFDQVGMLPEQFFYAHEETDLAWRALDAGWSVVYRADLVLHHPGTSPSRHAAYNRNVARNRVWLARRNLPWPLVPAYLVTWMLLTVARTRSLKALWAWFGGFVAGWREPCGERNPISWRTVWRMTKLGRPPIV